MVLCLLNTLHVSKLTVFCMERGGDSRPSSRWAEGWRPRPHPRLRNHGLDESPPASGAEPAAEGCGRCSRPVPVYRTRHTLALPGPGGEQEIAAPAFPTAGSPSLRWWDWIFSGENQGWIIHVTFVLVSLYEVRVCVLSCADSLWPVDCSPPGYPVHGILRVRILEWAAISFSRGSSPPRDRTRVSSISCTGKHVLSHLATWKSPCIKYSLLIINMYC